MKATIYRKDGSKHEWKDGKWEPTVEVPQHIHEELLKGVEQNCRREVVKQ